MGELDDAIKQFWDELKVKADSVDPVAPTPVESVRSQIDAMRRLPAVLFAKPNGIREVVGELEKLVKMVIFSQEGGEEAETKDSIKRLPDEVLVEMAMQLNRIGLVFGDDSIFRVLLALCSVDETTVREKAIEAIKDLCQKWSASDADLVSRCVAVPVVEMLESETSEASGNSSWKPAPVSACSLVAACYHASSVAGKPVTAKETGQEVPLALHLGALFQKQLASNNPMVRRTAAKSLGETITAIAGSKMAGEISEFAKEYRNLLVSDNEDCRTHALRASPAIFKALSLVDSDGDDLYNYMSRAEDKSYKVRGALADSLPGVMALASGEEQKAELFGCFMELLNDKERDVKEKTAKQSPAVAKLYVGEQRQRLIQAVTDMIMDENGVHHVELAEALMRIAMELSAEECCAHFFDEVHDVEGSDKKTSLFNDLTQTGHTTVRMTVLKNLVPLLRIASKSRNATGAVRNQLGVWDGFIKIDSDQSWRIRWQAMLLLPEFEREQIAEYSNDITISDWQDNAFIKLAWDSIAKVREDWLGVCLKCAQIVGKDSHFLTFPLKAVMRCFEDDNAALNSTKKVEFKSLVPRALAKWHALLGAIEIKQLVEYSTTMLKDTREVANIRLLCATSMGEVLAARVADSGTLSKLTDILKEQMKELTESSGGDVPTDKLEKELYLTCEEALSKGGR